MNPTKSWAYKQTGSFIEIDEATSYIQQEMQRIHSSNMSNNAQLMALEKLERTHHKLA